MEGIIIFIIGYLILIVVWLVFSTLLFALSFLFRKNLSSIPIGITYILSFIVQWGLIIYAFYILWQLISNGEWLLLILALIFGGFILGWWQFFYNLLLMPFMATATYFFDKVENTNFGDETVAGEVLDEKGKVVGIAEGDTSLKRRFAKYFIAVYVLQLAPIILFPVEREGFAPIDFVTTPFFRTITLTLIIGIPYGIYRLVRHKEFFTKDKRYFLIQTWKIALYIFIPFLAILFALAVLTNTL